MTVSKKLTDLSRIILPAVDCNDYADLFVRRSEGELLYKGKLQKVNLIKFNTWMNIFAAHKYFRYCRLDDLYLRIKTDCDCEVVISNLVYSEAPHNDDQVIKVVPLARNRMHQIEIDSPQSLENVYFTLVSKESDISIQASWATSSPPMINNKIAIISCTYKREEYIGRNVGLFKSFLGENPDLKDRFELLVVDNGRTLGKEIEGEHVTLYPNRNTGGAGGYTRGIIEALKDETITRVLLLDDDAEIFPESFFRTLMISDYLKDEYKKAFIGGSMLLFESKNIFFENAAVWWPSWVKAFHMQLDISKPENIAKSNYVPPELFTNEQKKVSSAWWYCSFSMQSVREKGLPLPFFVKCDDLEWSWRNYPEHHISMNGIFVWHMSFDAKINKVFDHYLENRNKIFANMLHTPGYKKEILRIFKRDFNGKLWLCDYSSCRIYLKMMQDVLKGSSVFEQDQEGIIKELSAMTADDEVYGLANLDEVKREKFIRQFRESRAEKNLTRRRNINNLGKLLYRLTLSGRLVPKLLWAKSRDIVYKIPSLDYKCFYAKKINLYSLGTNTVEVFRYDPAKRRRLLREFKKLYRQFDRNYDAVRQDYEKARDRFTTREFWVKYLGL